MNNNGIIYVTQKLVNGKIYVGIHTKGLSSYLGSGKYLNRAIKKYGRENFRRIDVDEFDDIEIGLAKERLWIQELNSKVPDGYNLNAGGEGQFNPCQEVIDKIRAKISGENHPMKRPEVAAKHSIAMMGNTCGKGYHHTEVHKTKLHGNIYAKGNKSKAGQIPWNKGKKGQKRTEAMKVNMGIAQLARWARYRIQGGK